MATPPVRSLAVHVFAAALLLYVATSGGSRGSSDAVVTFELTRSLVERGSVVACARRGDPIRGTTYANWETYRWQASRNFG